MADAGLGTINDVRLSLAALDDVAGDRRHRPAPVVVLNRFDAAADLHRRNLAWLRDRHAVCAIPGTDGLASLAARLAATVPGLTR